MGSDKREGEGSYRTVVRNDAWGREKKRNEIRGVAQGGKKVPQESTKAKNQTVGKRVQAKMRGAQTGALGKDLKCSRGGV